MPKLIKLLHIHSYLMNESYSEKGLTRINYDYCCIPVSMPFTSFTKYLYLKVIPKPLEESSDDEETTHCKVLLVSNLGPGCTKDSLRRIFETFGVVNKITFDSPHFDPNNPIPTLTESIQSLMKRQRNPETDPFFSLVQSDSKMKASMLKLKNLETSIMGDSGLNKIPFESDGYAIIEFDDETVIDNILKKDYTSTFGLSEISLETLGMRSWLKKWEKMYSIDPIEEQKIINKAIATYDKRQREDRRIKEKLATVPDDEGWVTVGKRGIKRGIATNKTQTQLRRYSAAKDEKKRHPSLYRITESRRSKLSELQSEFQKDKKKLIQKLRMNRKFA